VIISQLPAKFDRHNEDCSQYVNTSRSGAGGYI
jgi:hypothetical protein